MKKMVLTLVVLLGMNFGAVAQIGGGGLFGLGESSMDNSSLWYFDLNRTSGLLDLPQEHGLPDDQNAPLGSGALLLIGFGAAYAGLYRKKQK